MICSKLIPRSSFSLYWECIGSRIWAVSTLGYTQGRWSPEGAIGSEGILKYGDDSVTNTVMIPMTSRAELVRRGQVLEYLTLGCCSLEAVVAIAAGLMAGSVALVGFGFDSVIEEFSFGDFTMTPTPRVGKRQS